jgi:hypothetical protein
LAGEYSRLNVSVVQGRCLLRPAGGRLHVTPVLAPLRV